jgi:hypothetical protein
VANADYGRIASPEELELMGADLRRSRARPNARRRSGYFQETERMSMSL